MILVTVMSRSRMWTSGKGRRGRGHAFKHRSAYEEAVPREAGRRVSILRRSVPGGGPRPPREMVTDVDLAQARFEAGDAVRLAATGGWGKTGTIEKLNPMRARVRCEDGTWDVPYRLLEHLDEAPGDRKSEERLVEVAQAGARAHGRARARGVDLPLQRRGEPARRMPGAGEGHSARPKARGEGAARGR